MSTGSPIQQITPIWSSRYIWIGGLTRLIVPNGEGTLKRVNNWQVSVDGDSWSCIKQLVFCFVERCPESGEKKPSGGVHFLRGLLFFAWFLMEAKGKPVGDKPILQTHFGLGKEQVHTPRQFAGRIRVPNLSRRGHFRLGRQCPGAVASFVALG